jgi:hypothetical protein
METIKEPNLLRINYVFEASVERVFQMISDPVCQIEIYSPLISNFESLNEETLFVKGAKFKYNWKENLTMYLEIKDVTDELNYKMIYHRYEAVEPTKFQYNIIFKLFPVSTQMKTIMSVDVEFESQEAFNFYTLALNDNDKLSMFENMDKFLSKQLDLKQEESVILPVGFKQVWNIVTDLKVFKKHVPELAEEVEYDGDFVNMKVAGKMQRLKVVKKESNEEEGVYMLALEDDGNSRPTQEIVFNVICIDGLRCLLVFRHNFLVPVRYKRIQMLSESKKAILKTFKMSLKNTVL